MIAAPAWSQTSPPIPGAIERFRVASPHLYQPMPDDSFRDVGQLPVGAVDPARLAILGNPNQPYVEVTDGQRVMWIKRINLAVRPAALAGPVCEQVHFAVRAYDGRAQGLDECK